MSWGDVFKEKMVTWLLKRIGHTEDSKLMAIKVRYAVDIIISTTEKAVVILTVVLLLERLQETVIVLVAFNIVRVKASGLHASNSLKCLLVSLVIFVLLPMCFDLVIIPDWVAAIWYVTLAYLLHTYAPADTVKNPILGKHHRDKMRISSSRNMLFVAVVSMAGPSTFQIYYLIGSTIAVVVVLPLTYKILKRSRNNYEIHE